MKKSDKLNNGSLAHFGKDGTQNIGCRHGQVFFLFSGNMISYIIRTSMSVSIVAMTDKNSENPDVTTFQWTSAQQSLILSSLLWGSTAAQVPLGFLYKKLGGSQKTLCYGIFITSVMMLVLPVLADNLGFVAVLICRVIAGIGQGALIPCIKTQVSNWVPLSERGLLGSFVLNGSQLGNVFAMFLSGILAASTYGWPSIYYVYGAAGFIWSILYWWFGAESPAHHKSISSAEKVLIEESLAQKSDEKKLPFPWKKVLTSLPVWSLFIAQISQNWNYNMLLSEMPLYMKSILKFDIEQSGTVSAIPQVAKWLLVFPIGWASDFALRKGLPVTLIRKTCNSIGMWGPGVMFLILCFVNSDEIYVPVILMTLGFGLNAANSCGQEMNEIDIAPNFVGELSSLSNTVGKIFGFLAPIGFAAIVSDSTNADQWSIIFYITSATYFLGNLVFIIFGKAEVQPWNNVMPSSTSWDDSMKKVSIVSRTSNT